MGIAQVKEYIRNAFLFHISTLPCSSLFMGYCGLLWMWRYRMFLMLHCLSCLSSGFIEARCAFKMHLIGLICVLMVSNPCKRQITACLNAWNNILPCFQVHILFLLSLWETLFGCFVLVGNSWHLFGCDFWCIPSWRTLYHLIVQQCSLKSWAEMEISWGNGAFLLLSGFEGEHKSWLLMTRAEALLQKGCNA